MAAKRKSTRSGGGSKSTKAKTGSKTKKAAAKKATKKKSARKKPVVRKARRKSPAAKGAAKKKGTTRRKRPAAKRRASPEPPVLPGALPATDRRPEPLVEEPEPVAPMEAEPAPLHEESVVEAPWAPPDEPPMDPEPEEAWPDIDAAPPEQSESWEPEPAVEEVAEMSPEPEPEPWQAAPEPTPEPVPEKPPAPPSQPPTNVPSLEKTAPETKPGWTVVRPQTPAAPAPATPTQPAPQPAGAPEDLRVRFDEAAVRMGLPWMAAVGWTIFLLGLGILAYGYYDLYLTNADTILYAGGLVRLDVLGAILLIVGLAIAISFHFLPKKRAMGPQPNDSTSKWIARADRSRTLERLHRSLATAGWVLVIVGLLVAVTSFYYSWVNSGVSNVDYGTTVAGYTILYWRAGVALALLGALLFLLTYPRIHHAREARQGYLLAALAAATRPPAVIAKHTEPAASQAAVGARPAELKALMRRIDQLLSTLPEDKVAEFAQSKEADTYLRLLESS